MENKKLKRLSRVQLLEMLIEESKRNQILEAELKAAKEQLESREINIREAGTLAEASVKLNGVFEAAQAAGHQYLENIRRMEKEIREKYIEIKKLEKNDISGKLNHEMSEDERKTIH